MFPGHYPTPMNKTYSTFYSTFTIWNYCIDNKIDITNVSEDQATFLKLIFPNIILDLNDISKSESQISKSDS